MKFSIHKPLLGAVGALLIAGAATPIMAADAICYNCPPQWADWASQLKAIEENLGYKLSLIHI